MSSARSKLVTVSKEGFPVPKLTKKTPDKVVEHLNRVLSSNDALTFQKVLLDFVHGHYDLAQVAKQAGVRRETIWRYRTGAAQAPFETLVKIIALIGAKFVIVAD
jgi:DNA-binding phage protein